MQQGFRKYGRIILNGRTYTFSEPEKSLSLFSDYPDLLSFLKEWMSRKDVIELHTSGSTGLPKKIIVKKDAMVLSAKRTIDFLGLQPGMTALLALPLSFIAGKMMVVRAIVGGLNLIYQLPSGNPMKNIDIPIDFAAFTPMQMHKIINETAEKSTLLQNVIIGGAPLSSSLEKKLKLQPFNAWETYGMTETVSHIALRKITGNDSQEHLYPLKGISVGLQENSCLFIDAPGISENLVLSNDLAQIYADGSFMIKGRIDHIINSGGIKVIPELLEAEIQSFFDAEFVISSVPDPEKGEKVIMVVEGNSFDTGALMTEINRNIDKYERPVFICFLKSFPRSKNGKILRLNIRSLVLKTLDDSNRGG